MKIVKVLIIVIMFCLIGASCSNILEKAPEIIVKINEQEIEYIMQETSWENKQSSYPEPLQWIIQGNADIEIPYISIAETVSIEFMENPPVELYLEEYIVYYENGVEISRRKESDTQLKLKNKKVSFDFSPITNIEDNYEDCTIYRGYVLMGKWKNNSYGGLNNVCYYIFVIRTNE